MREPELRQLMDALGRDEADGQEAEFAPLREAMDRHPQVRRDLARIQAWDHAIEQALDEGATPAGLEQRLLAAVQAQSEIEADTSTADSAPAASPTPTPTPARGVDTQDLETPSGETAAVQNRAFWSRRDIWSLAGLALTLLLLGGLALWSRDWSRPVAVDELTQTAEQTVANLPEDGWRAEDLPLETYPVDASLRLSRQLMWRRIHFLDDRQAVVYRDEGGRDEGGRQAVHLIVARSERVVDLPPLPPSRPQQLTGASMVATWKQPEGMLSVLVFEGDMQRYQQLIRPLTVAATSLFGDPVRFRLP